MSLANGSEFKQLTIEEERAAWAAGDYDAMVVSCWPYVLLIAGRMAKRDELIYDELISAAHCTLTRALRLYDPAKETRFLSYAAHFLRIEMVRARKRFLLRTFPVLRAESARQVGGGAGVDHVRVEAEDLRAVVARVCKPAEVEALVGVSEGKTYQEIGDHMGVTRQRVQQRYVEAVKKCRAAIADGTAES